MEKHKVVLLEESKLEAMYQQIMQDESLKLVRHAVAHRYRKGIPVRFSLQSKGVDLFKLEDPDKGGTWLFFWNEDEEPRRVLIGKRRLNRLIGRFANG